MTDLACVQRGTTMWVTLSRPAAGNPLSRALCGTLVELAAALDARDDVHAVVVTGAGDAAFSIGADLDERRGVVPDALGQHLAMISAAVEAWAALRAPTLAAIGGDALGAGLALALACDVRIAVEGAALGFPEVRDGTLPSAGATVRLPRLLGDARARQLLLFGRPVSAARALAIGLVDQVTARADLVAAVEAWLDELRGCAPIAVQQAKAAIAHGHGRTLDDALAFEHERGLATLLSDDWQEAIAARAAGRPPRFRGR